MLQTRWKPDYVAGATFLDRSALTLNPSKTGRDYQCLAERMRMPGRTRARFECYAPG
jgi:hypothetical protein